jgi:multidrug efflux system membrane fusion protein
MRRRAAAIVGAACLLLAAGAAVAYSRSRGERIAVPAAAPVVSVPVVAQAVAIGDVPLYLRGIGNVQAYNTVTVHSQIEGQIVRIAFTEGQAVHAGDLLAEIDPAPFQAQLDQAVANRERDQAQLANAQQILDRDLPLSTRDFISAQTIATQRDQVAQLTAAVKSDEAAIKTAEVQLGYTRLTSPIDGVVGLRQIDIGNIIHPTDPNGLVTVTQIQPISAVFTLPETDLPRIQQAMAGGAATVLAYSQDNKTNLDRGTLAALDNQIIQATGSVRLKGTFPNRAHHLWPGALINVWLLIENRRDALTIPAQAVQQGPRGAYVYVVRPDATVASRAVVVAQIGDLRAVIDSGLARGDRVVVAGQSRIAPGMHVTLLQGAAAALALAASSGQQAFQ